MATCAPSAWVFVALAVASCGSSSDFDEDKDGFYDSTEDYTGTDRLNACGDGAWPPDFDDDKAVTGSDLSQVGELLSQKVPDAPVRNDLNPDGVITGADISAVAGRIGTSCAPQ